MKSKQSETGQDFVAMLLGLRHTPRPGSCSQTETWIMSCFGQGSGWTTKSKSSQNVWWMQGKREWAFHEVFSHKQDGFMLKVKKTAT
jgi:hypothetical protein